MSDEVVIDPEIRDLIPPLTDDEKQYLEQSILADGCRNALMVWYDNEKPILLDGHHRREICDRHQISYRFATLRRATRDDAIQWVIENQRGRRNLSRFAIAELGLKYLEIEEKKARERQRNGGHRAGSRIPGSNDPNLGRSDEKAAAVVGLSAKTLQRAKKVVQNADQKTIAKLRRGESTIHNEYKKITSAERKAKAKQKIQLELDAMPDGPFRVIVADPSWKFDTREDDPTHRGKTDYPPMTIQEIQSLPVNEIAHEDCICFLWTTNTHLHDAFHVMEKWGFEYKVTGTWVKPRIGTGNWLRNRTEHCLVGIQGNPVVELKGESTAIYGKLREHSRKPVEFYEMVESLCPGSKCELFSRETRDGWSSWGAEKDMFDNERSSG